MIDKTNPNGFWCLVVVLFMSLLMVKNGYAQRYTLRTNLISTAVGSASFGIEGAIGSNSTALLDVSYQGWQVLGDIRTKHILIQPELRWWKKYRYWGMFYGVHGLFTQYNVGGIGLLGLDGSRVEGEAFGGGFSYGYQWIISNKLNIEATMGVGYARISYAKYGCEQCGDFKGDGTLDHIGPTKLGVSLIYLL